MVARVVIYEILGNARSEAVCTAMAAGIRRVGDHATIRSEGSYDGNLSDAAVFYGFRGKLPKVLSDHAAAGAAAVYVDLGYWARRGKARLEGFHKVAVNDRHPTAYFQRRAHNPARFRALGVAIKPWSSGSKILLAGMSDKGAASEGLQPEEWERWAIDEIRSFSERSIVYRPKPSWRDAKPIAGTEFSPAEVPLQTALKDTHVVVTHHSNVAVDAVLAGVPAFCWEGVASAICPRDFDTIDHPSHPANREQWAADIAFCQWTLAEMRQGLPWRHLKDEGLVP